MDYMGFAEVSFLIAFDFIQWLFGHSSGVGDAVDDLSRNFVLAVLSLILSLEVTWQTFGLNRMDDRDNFLCSFR